MKNEFCLHLHNYLLVFINLEINNVSAIGQLYTTEANRTYYIEMDREFTFEESRNECYKMDMQLVEIGTSEKSMELTGLIESIDVDLWIGGIANDDENFIWISTGNKFTFTNWNFGEPSSVSENKCVQISLNGDISWTNCNCEELKGFICEFTYEKILKDLEKNLQIGIENIRNLQKELKEQKEEHQEQLQKLNEQNSETQNKLKENFEKLEETLKNQQNLENLNETILNLENNLKAEIKKQENLKQTELKKQTEEHQEQLQKLTEQHLETQNILKENFKKLEENLKQELQCQQSAENNLKTLKDTKDLELSELQKNNRKLTNILFS
ncbi:golgin subfamily A member 4-like [Lucilia sericata]|uniref:golgin subfamily A member 4-like n=1 Tax=Lucilia sericata TaxID=13632 RepID=UPI0018A83481|nr:golgin subfamily A member 4-like [Lucilia sericata]